MPPSFPVPLTRPRPTTRPDEPARRRKRQRKRQWLFRALSGWNSVEAARDQVALFRPFGCLCAPHLPVPPPSRVIIPGVIHVHTTYSDGRSGVAEIVRTAREEGLRFLVLADHDTLRPLRDGWEGYQDEVLVLVGTEMRTSGGYLPALGLRRELDLLDESPAVVLDAVAAAGGLAFAVHPAHPVLRWEEWSHPALTGLEVLNLHALSRHAASLPALPRFLGLLACGRSRQALRMLTVRPRREVGLWDRRIQQAGRAVGLAAADAHGQVRVSRRRWIAVPTYRESFRLVQTHLVLPAPLARDAKADLSQVLDAVAQGRCRLVYPENGDPEGFRFHYAGLETATEGEAAVWTPGAGFTACSPHHRTLFRLYRNGALIAAAEGGTAHFPCPGPGAYRLECDRYSTAWGALRLGVRPWIFCNPIYVQ